MSTFLNIAMFVFFLHIALNIVALVFGGFQVNPVPEVKLPLDPRHIFSPQHILRLVMESVAIVVVGAGLAIALGGSAGAFIMSITMLAAIYLTLSLFAGLASPLFDLGSTLNAIVQVALGVGLPAPFVVGLNMFMRIVMILAVADVFRGAPVQ